MKYFRKRFRRRAYRSTFKKYFRKPRPGTRRFYRRQRRNARPEIKTMVASWPLTAIQLQTASDPGVNFTTNLMPLTVSVGDTGVNDRDGRYIKTRRTVVQCRFTALTNISTGNLRPDAQIRYWIWAPRIDYNNCLQLITSAKTLTILPYNMFTVYKTGMIKVGNSGVAHTDTATDELVPNTNVFPSDVYRKFIVPHIRTITFPPAVSSITEPNKVDEEKYQLYITFCNESDYVVRTTGQTLTTYIDP